MLYFFSQQKSVFWCCCSRSNRSAAYAALHKWEEALEDANSAIKLKPDWAKAYTRKGLALYNLNRAEDALTAYKKAAALDPKSDPKDIKLAGQCQSVRLRGKELLLFVCQKEKNRKVG